MKAPIIGVALAAFAAITPVGAQGRAGNQGVPPGQMPPAGMCRVWIDGVPPGRQPRPTDCATARANVPVNGRVIYGGNRNSRQDCTYSRSTNSVGDIIFGRSGSNTTNCVDNPNTRLNGAWYPVGNDGNGGTIYERQTRNSNGNLIVQRARRDRNGKLSIISTRNAGTSTNGRYNGTYDSRSTNGRYEDGRYNSRDDGDDDRDEGNGRGKGHGNGHGKGEGHGRD